MPSSRLALSLGIAFGAALVGAAVLGRKRRAAGAIRRKASETTASATGAGAVLKLATTGTVCVDPDVGVHFWVSVKDAKAEAGRKASGAGAAAKGPRKPAFDPFEHPEDALIVERDLTLTHYLQLNKFPVVDDHLLVVTKAWEAQTDVATAADFGAIGAALRAVDGFLFFNCGAASGASQPHKHFQLLPRDTLRASQAEAPLPYEIPMEGLILGALPQADPSGDDARRLDASIATVLPAPLGEALIVAARLPPGWWEEEGEEASAAAARGGGCAGCGCGGAARVTALYERLLHHAGLPISRDGVDHCRDAAHPSHNMVCTRRWMVVAHRACEPCAETGIGCNACGFGGFFLVRDAAQLAALKSRGPARALVDLCARR